MLGHRIQSGVERLGDIGNRAGPWASCPMIARRVGWEMAVSTSESRSMSYITPKGVMIVSESLEAYAGLAGRVAAKNRHTSGVRMRRRRQLIHRDGSSLPRAGSKGVWGRHCS